MPLRGSLGEEGREESVISSMSEWDEADLGDFFLLKACLKELRSCNDNREKIMKLRVSQKMMRQHLNMCKRSSTVQTGE